MTLVPEMQLILRYCLKDPFAISRMSNDTFENNHRHESEITLGN